MRLGELLLGVFVVVVVADIVVIVVIVVEDLLSTHFGRTGRDRATIIFNIKDDLYLLGRSSHSLDTVEFICMYEY